MAHKDLIPVTQRTKEEARIISSNGGKASGVSRAKKRDLKLRIAATWEVYAKIKDKNLKTNLKKLIKEPNSDENPEVQILKDKIELLGTGGADMLILMEILDNPKTSALTKATVIENLINHEHGKAQGNESVKHEWADGIGKSPAFSGNSILLGIRHGIKSLSIIDLDEVSAMINEERENRVIVVDEIIENN